MRIRSLLAGILAWTPLAAAALEVGEPVPDFTFYGPDGVVHSRSDTLGQRGVVIAWFPKAFTPG